jgi:hypothetical protein
MLDAAEKQEKSGFPSGNRQSGIWTKTPNAAYFYWLNQSSL